MNDIPKHDWTKNEDEFFAWEDNGIMDRVQDFIETLDWDKDDDIVVEIGGMAVTGTATNPDANPKWAKPFGTVTYQKDAFIVIKNRSRSPFAPSQPNPNLKQKHEFTGGK